MSSDPHQVELACAARRDYLPHAATMIASALANAGARLRVHLLVGDDVADAEADAVAEMLDAEGGELRLHRPADRRLEALKTTSTFPTAHWYRVLLPELLAGSDRVIYLDADALVLDSLLPLWRSELGGDLLAAVSNVFPDRAGAERLCRRLGVPRERYFNSGVMLLDCAGLRRERSAERVIEWAQANAEALVLPEQDAMNAVLARSRAPLAPRWNAMIANDRFEWADELFSAEELREMRERPAIRHFEGSGANKPWHDGADPEARALYQRYRARTPWPAVERDGEPVRRGSR